MAVTRKVYVKHLKRVLELHEERDISLQDMCPAAFRDECYNPYTGVVISEDWCGTCRNFFECKELDDRLPCPCDFWGKGNILEEAHKRINEWEAENEKEGSG